MHPSKVYQSGTAPGRQCANEACNATETSGSWRKGWPLEGQPGLFANLCNRCGQRWSKTKDKKGLTQVTAGPDSEQAPPQPKKRPPTLPDSEQLGHSASSPSPKRHATERSIESAAGLAAPAAAAGNHSRLMVPVEPAPMAASLAAVAPRQQAQPQQAQQQRQAAGQFVSYTIQKTTSSKGNHALFWLQDAKGQHTLAVVGHDTRMSGHFVYSSSPDFTAAPPLRCTNRTEVTRWLEGFGVREFVAEGACGQLPELSAADKKRLLTGEPVWAKPQMDMSAWTAVREESGRLVDGRHFKRFFLLGPAGAEKLAVTGVDSIRKDRRYKYHAEECMGGFCFENSREVLDWLNFVLDRPASDPIQPEQVRATQPLTEEQLGKAAASKAPALAPVRTKPLPAPRPPAERAAKARERAQQQQQGEEEQQGDGRAGAMGGQLGWEPSRQGRLDSGPVLGLASGSGSGGGSGGNTAAAMMPQAAGGAARPQAGMAHFGGKVRPQPLLQLRFRCACCGMTDHATDECPLAALSPTTLIRKPTMGLSQDPALLHSLVSMPSEGGLLAMAAPSTPAAAMAVPAAPATSTGGSAGGVLEFHAGERKVSPSVKAAYQEFPRLQQWVAATPSDFTVDTFRAWAERLGGHICDEPPLPSASEEEEPLGGWRWVPTAEALAILRELNNAQVNLALLESTGISRAVAMLRTHRIDEVSKLAEGIVAKWRACAVAALHHATTALEETE